MFFGTVMSHDVRNSVIFTAHKRSLQRLCFYTCLSVHGGEYRYTSQAGTPHSPRQVHSPGQVHPTSWAGTPPSRYTPQTGTPGAGTPPHPLPSPGSSACWEIRATSGRYAYYWNAFLLILRAMGLVLFD